MAHEHLRLIIDRLSFAQVDGPQQFRDDAPRSTRPRSPMFRTLALNASLAGRCTRRAGVSRRFFGAMAAPPGQPFR